MKNQTAQTRGLKSKQTIKRLAANKCERERVRKLNEAFESLKKHVQCHDPTIEIRTKHDVLKFAIDYIQILQKSVSQSEAAGNILRATQMETESILMLNAETRDVKSPRPSNKPFPAVLDPQDPARFDQQKSLLVSQVSFRD